MAEYMLDTDSVSFAIRGEGRVAERIREHRPSRLCVSSITLAELRFGAESKKSRRLQELIETFIAAIEVVPFDAGAARSFGVVAATLAREGQPIGELDTLIAAHALSLGVTLVTNNTKHFSRVAGLPTENWT
jgi:tRNA(fMet)-specific endonuclease VapC